MLLYSWALRLMLWLGEGLGSHGWGGGRGGAGGDGGGPEVTGPGEGGR